MNGLPKGGDILRDEVGQIGVLGSRLYTHMNLAEQWAALDGLDFFGMAG